MTRRTAKALARGAAAAAGSASPAAPVDDSDQLERETASAGEAYAQRCAGIPDFNRHDPPIELAEIILRKAPQDFSFFDIERLAAVDPELSQRKWAEVKATARDDLARGWLAGRYLHRLGSDAWGRASFLAIRTALREGWPPRNSAEAQLIDQLAQYEFLRQHWVGIMAEWSDLPAVTLDRRTTKQRTAHRDIANLDALREAARMVETCQRLFRSTLTVLLKVRRGPHPTLFAKTGPIHVSTGPQLHLAGQPAEFMKTPVTPLTIHEPRLD